MLEEMSVLKRVLCIRERCLYILRNDCVYIKKIFVNFLQQTRFVFTGGKVTTRRKS